MTLATAKLTGYPVYAYNGIDFAVRMVGVGEAADVEARISDCLDEMGIETDEDLLALLVAVKDGAFGAVSAV